jgi:hypothetical protein
MGGRAGSVGFIGPGRSSTLGLRVVGELGGIDSGALDDVVFVGGTDDDMERGKERGMTFRVC